MLLIADLSVWPVTTVYLLLVLMIGYAIVCAASTTRTPPAPELFGYSFTAGAGGLSLLLFFTSMAGFVPTRSLLAVIGVGTIVWIISLAKRGRALRPDLATGPRKFDLLFLLGIAALVVVVAAALNVQARSHWPELGEIDPLAIWLFKAKQVATFPLRPMPAAFQAPGLSYSHQDYPLAMPFLFAGIYALGGGVFEGLGKTLLLPQYLALVAVVYSTLRRLHRGGLALTVTAIFAAAPVLTKNAGLAVAETPLLLAYASCLSMLLRWSEDGHPGDLVLAGFFAAVAAFTKNEGLALLPVVGVAGLALACLRRRAHRTAPATSSGTGTASLKIWLIAVACAVILILPWLVFRNGLPRTHENYGGKLRSANTLIDNLPRLKQIVPFFFEQMRDAQNAGPIWYVLALTAVLGWRGFARGSVLIFWAVLVTQIGLYAATFVVTPWDLKQLLGMITPKLLVQASPVAMLLIGLHLRSAGPSGSPEAAPLRISSPAAGAGN